jgi:hypothetical protein
VAGQAVVVDGIGAGAAGEQAVACREIYRRRFEGRQILNLGAQRGRPRLLYPGSDTTSLPSRKKQS